jgi:ubiquinone/menaquinone biosynthesis C-methylase UbiE
MSIFPFGGQQGTEFHATIRGRSLETASSVWFDCDHLSATISGVEIQEAPESASAAKELSPRQPMQLLSLAVKVAPGAEPGIHYLRVMNRGGLSNDLAVRVHAESAARGRTRGLLVIRPESGTCSNESAAANASAVIAPPAEFIHIMSLLRSPALSSSQRNPVARPGHCAVASYCLTMAALLSLCAPAAAQLGARSTEEWLKTLDSANRVARLKVDEAVAALQLKPGSVVADIGAGSGVFTLPLAKAVAGTGKVYAVDIEQGLVNHIAQKAKEEKATNVQAVLGQFTDPNLPGRDVDLAFIYDVLHHVENRAEYIRNLAPYLKRAGRIAVIDFHPELGPHKNDPKLQITRDQTKAWMAAIGFKQVAEHKLYDDKWFVVYSR